MIRLNKITKVSTDSSSVRLCYDYTINRKDVDLSQCLWFEFDQDYENWLVTEVCDAFILAMFPYCIRHGDDIVTSIPADRKFLANMERLIALLVHECPDEYRDFSCLVSAQENQLKWIDKDRSAVLASGSCGVDALHTLWASEKAKYGSRPTHLVFNNTGSNNAGPDPTRLLAGRIANTQAFCRETGYGYLGVQSNYREIIGLHYDLTNTYVNVAIGFMLARNACQYFVSSGYDIKTITFSGDPAHAEAVILPLLKSSYFEVTHVANDSVNRYVKVGDLLGYGPARRFLNVCFSHPRNCGSCEKCRRVLMALECYGGVEKFGQVFDLQRYKRERKHVFALLICDHWDGNVFVDEMWNDFRIKLSFGNWLEALKMRIHFAIVSTAAWRWINKTIRHRG